MAKGGDGWAPPTDPRARRSRAALQTALIQLIEVEDLGRISVSDLTKQAGVGRSTFYEHFDGVHDLAVSACTEVFDQLVAGQPMLDPAVAGVEKPPTNPLVPVFEHFEEHARLYRALLGPDGSARVINHLLHRMLAGAYANLRDGAVGASTHANDPAAVPSDADSAFIAGALLGVVVDWLRHEKRDTPEELAAAVWPGLLAAASVGGLEHIPTTRRPGDELAG